jgi:hypothetical protein
MPFADAGDLGLLALAALVLLLIPLAIRLFAWDDPTRRRRGSIGWSGG